MEKEIVIKIRNKIAERISGEYVCGNSDFVAVFDFDEEWNAYDTKTARIDIGDEYFDVVFSGNQCAIPILSNIHSFYIGVFAGNLKTSTPAYVPARKSVLCGDGSPAAPPKDVYAQIMELLKGISEPTSEDIESAVNKYFDEHGISADDMTVKTLSTVWLTLHNGNVGAKIVVTGTPDNPIMTLLGANGNELVTISRIAEPENSTDAATKGYVDGKTSAEAINALITEFLKDADLDIDLTDVPHIYFDGEEPSEPKDGDLRIREIPDDEEDDEFATMADVKKAIEDAFFAIAIAEEGEY